jgi:sugar/nucleoside kinase (ribokinase family)
VPRLGVLGSLVWDRIHARDRRSVPVEEWGGIAYALAGAAAALPDGWTIVPIIRIGRDLRDPALEFLKTLPGADLETGLRLVREPNNRVELRYHDRERRFERMTGGVPPWPYPELEAILGTLDALYVNFISGFEMSRETAIRMRQAFTGPVFGDLHSLLLGMEPGGLRTPQPLEAWREWVRCFDVVQVNEEELTWLAHAWGDPWRFAAEVVGAPVRLLLVTLGSRGAAYVAPPDLDTGDGCIGSITSPPTVAKPGPALSRRLEAGGGPEAGDPTGCGDVFGATCWCHLLAGRSLEDAMNGALDAAARNVRHRGATGLHHHLSGRIAT